MTTHNRKAPARAARAEVAPAGLARPARPDRRHRRPPAVVETDLPFGGRWRVLIHM